MDPATQGLLGANAVQIFYARKPPQKLWLAGIAAGMAADLDILIRSPSNPMLYIYFHRHFTHALAFIPFGGLLVALLLLACYQPFREMPKRLIAACIIGYATHGFIDTCTSYGTVWLWPVTDKRVAFDIISIIDPVFTSILFIGLAISVIYERAKPAILALLLAAAYLGLGMFQHHRAHQLQLAVATDRGTDVYKGRVMPALATQWHWRSIYTDKQRIYIDYFAIPLLKPAFVKASVSFEYYDITQVPQYITRNAVLMQDLQIFNWFSDGFLSQIKNEPLVLSDMRYVIDPYTKPKALWSIEFPTTPGNAHVKWLRRLDISEKGR